MDEHHSIQMKNVPVKKGDKILFKEIKEYGGVITQLAINFRPKNDKKAPYYYDIGPDETFISVETSRSFALFLPKDPHPGRMIMIKPDGGDFKLWGNENKIKIKWEQDYIEFSSEDSKTFIFNDKSMWYVVS